MLNHNRSIHCWKDKKLFHKRKHVQLFFFFTFHEEAKNSQIKVTESLEFMSAKFEIKRKDEKINQFEKAIENLAEKQKSLSSEIDDLEQYSRRNCLVLHGVNESNNENTNEILIKTFS